MEGDMDDVERGFALAEAERLASDMMGRLCEGDTTVWVEVERSSFTVHLSVRVERTPEQPF